MRRLRHPAEGPEDGGVLRRQHDCHPGDVQARGGAVPWTSSGEGRQWASRDRKFSRPRPTIPSARFRFTGMFRRKAFLHWYTSRAGGLVLRGVEKDAGLVW